MTRTTPLRPLDVLAAIPEMAAYARATTRLHPRRGAPTPRDSSIGGPLLWPADEPWPVCTAPYREKRSRPADPELAAYFTARANQRRRLPLTAEQEAILADPPVRGRIGSARCIDGVWELVWYDSTGHVPPNPLVAIGQLFASDVPTINFPDGMDVLQILWCPLDHSDVPGQRYYAGPPVHLFWRRADEIGDTLVAPPQPRIADERFYLPIPCVVHPEQVVEYQYSALLPPAIRDQVESAEEEWEEVGASYQYDLSIAPGCKAGGWASWHLTDPWGLTCSECGAGFDLLVGFDSSEWDGTKSWKPVEDDADDRDAQCPTGLTHGRWGEMRIFVCSADVTHPFQLNIQ